MFNYFRFRYRRQVRRFRREFRLIRSWSGNYVDRHIWGKWHQLGTVRRFLLVWWGIIALLLVGLTHQLSYLRASTEVLVPTPGGIYSEAAVGTVQALNPILPETGAASDINRLVFSSLTRYNSQRQLVGDLATSWTVSDDGKTYTFHLRHGVKWQDGVPFTSTDVAFTLAAIQNPDSRSPLASSWQGVNVQTKGDDTVIFTLPNALASFIDSTTLEIVPRHLLESVEPSQLREADFNQHPIGTGPFMIKTFAPEANEISLAANDNYYGGRPQLDEFDFRLYQSSADALDAYARRQVTSPGRIASDIMTAAIKSPQLRTIPMTLPEETTLFFRVADTTLSDAKLRSILSASLNRSALLEGDAGGDGQVVTQPLLPGQIGYNAKYAPMPLAAAAAKQALTDDGWTLSAGQTVRQKNDQKLQLTVVTLAGGTLERVAKDLRSQYAALGIDLAVKTVDLDALQQSYMRPRNFQLLLYGINVGADPDVYSFWHSSQAQDPGLNLSGYQSNEADKALEAARIKSDPALRAAKYDAFLKAWNTDVPAAVLYQTGYTYGQRDNAAGVVVRDLVLPEDRFYGVERWTVRQRSVQRS